MIKRLVTIAAALPPAQELDPDLRKQLRGNFSPLAARRLTPLSLMLGEVTRDAAPQPADEWIFTSQFGASVSLEKYLASFPTPSPLHFQNSIQPGPLDLVNVSRQQPARQLLPVIGEKDVFGDALLAALISPAPVVHLTAGEEFEPWAADRKLGAEATLALYLKLEQNAESPLAEVAFFPGEVDLPPPPDLASTVEAILNRAPLAFTLPERGAIRLSWM